MLRPVVLCFALLVPCAYGQAASLQSPSTKAVVPGNSAERTALTRGRALVKDFYAVRVETLWQAFVPDLREEWGSLVTFRAFRTMGVTTYGAEKQMVRERVFSNRGITYYVRTARFERDPQNLWNIVFGFDGVGRVMVFAIAAEEQTDSEQIA